MRIRTRALLACLALAATPAPAVAQSDAPGDSYLGAIRLNPGPPDDPQPLPEAGASFSVDTTSYGLQSGDIYSPPSSGGIQEPNRCSPTRYGKTAWGWLHTPRWARADVRASAAFDPVLAVMPFTSPGKPRLSPSSGACVNRANTMTEAFGEDGPILAPGWYAVQVGGAEDASGQATGGRLDVTVVLQTPPRVAAQARASARRERAGAAVNVKASAPAGARVAFACRGRKCDLPARRTVPRAGSRSYLRGRSIPNGARLELRVTRAGHIGSYFAWKVRNGRLGRVLARCLEPSSTRPRASCDG